MPLVSIIIPVYNTEKFLVSCIDSVLAQSVRDFELLLVNDGSTDSSLAICQEYASKDSRVRVFDKPNGGVSSARNMGLEMAQGEWVMFVDSDDTITSNTLELCLAHGDDSDIVRFSFKYMVKTGVELRPVLQASSVDEFLRLQILCRTGYTVCGGLYRRSLFVDNAIYFDPNIIYGEDWLVAMRLTLNSRRVVALPDAYCYIYNTVNVDNCSNSMTPRKVGHQLEVLKIMRGLVGKGYGATLRNARCRIARDVIYLFSPEVACDYLLTVNDKIDFISCWDVVLADLSLRKKIRLWRFMRYCHSRGLRSWKN